LQSRGQTESDLFWGDQAGRSTKTFRFRALKPNHCRKKAQIKKAFEEEEPFKLRISLVIFVPFCG